MGENRKEVCLSTCSDRCCVTKVVAVDTYGGDHEPVTRSRAAVHKIGSSLEALTKRYHRCMKFIADISKHFRT